MKQDMMEGKIYYGYSRHHVQEDNGIDIKLRFNGPRCIFSLCSTNALKEFMKLVPSKLDRMPFLSSIGKLFPNSMLQNKSSEDWSERRKAFSSMLDLNSSSKYIPMMLDSVKAYLKDWKEGENIELTNQMNLITFKITISILFGEDSVEYNKKLMYKHVDGRYTELDSIKFLLTISGDLFKGFYSFKTMAFPFLNSYNIGEPYKTNLENINTFWNYIRNFLENTKDENSAFMRLRKLGYLEDRAIFDDLIGFLLAGFETSSRAVTSTMYHAKKYPDKLRKLIDSLEANGIMQYQDNKNTITKEKIQEIDYLNYFVREALRIDGPSISGLPYEAKEDITICSVKLPKGSEVQLDIVEAAYNPKQWLDPFDFIPERFDPSSRYFKTPEKKLRDPCSMIPFSLGIRKCPGQTLAMLELKTILAYIFTSIDYSISTDAKNSNNIGFGMGSV